MGRQAIAWLLIGLMILALAAVVAWKVYHARDRRIGRQRSREHARWQRRLEENNID